MDFGGYTKWTIRNKGGKYETVRNMMFRICFVIICYETYFFGGVHIRNMYERVYEPIIRNTWTGSVASLQKADTEYETRIRNDIRNDTRN